MTDAQTSHRARKRLRRRWLVAIATLVILGVGGALVYRHYTHPKRIVALAETYLRQFVGGEVKVGRAEFSWLDGVRLYDVEVWAKTDASEEPGGTTAPVGRAEPVLVFSCPLVDLAHDPVALLLGRWSVHSVVAVDPHCRIVRDAGNRRTTLEGMFRQGTGGGLALSDKVPAIELRHARISVARREGGAERIIQELELTLRGKASGTQRGWYDIVWQEHGPRQASGRSQVDLRTGHVRNVQGGLPWMSIEAVMVAIDAKFDGAGSWCDLLGLDGTVRATDYALSDDGRQMRSAEIQLQDAAISIPIDESEQHLPADQRYLRFEKVHGTVKVTKQGIEATFDGVFHGSACSVRASFAGGIAQISTLDDVDFDATLSVAGLTFPRPGPGAAEDEARFIEHWRATRNFYRDYDPVGIVDVELWVTKRAGPDEPIVLRSARLTPRGVSASCRFFPYRISELSGVVEFTPTGVHLRDLRGTHEGASISVDGWLDQPNRLAAADVHITGRQVPTDSALYEALKSRDRRIWDQFRPSGLFDVDVQLTRPSAVGGQPAPWRTVVTIDFDDLRANYTRFPYPLDHLRGKVVIDRDSVQMMGITSRVGQRVVTINGSATFKDQTVQDMDVRIAASKVDINTELIDALPDRLGRLVRACHPKGSCDINAVLAFDEKVGAVRPTFEIVLDGVTIRHDLAPITIANLTGPITVDAQLVVFDKLTGSHDGATITISGHHKRDSVRGSASTTLQIDCDNLVLDDAIRNALPPAVRAALAPWQVDDPLGVDLTLSGFGDEGEASRMRAVVRADGVTIHRAGFPRPFSDVSGKITVDESHMVATGIVARYGPASIRMSFESRRDETSESCKVQMLATDVELDASLHDLLPDSLQRTWDRMAPSGVVDVELVELSYERDAAAVAAGTPRPWRAAGSIALRDVSLAGVARAAHLFGTIEGSGRLVDRDNGVSLAGTVDLASIELYDRRFENLTGTWSFLRSARGDGRFTLRDVIATAYDGTGSAELLVLFDPSAATYELTATAQSMKLEPLINAPPPKIPALNTRTDVRGLADVRLSLAGTIGEPSTRRGAGRIEIAEGHLYRLPVMLAILHVINLSIPNGNAFDKAGAEFFIVGDRMELEHILLQSKVLALAGSGSLSLADYHLDIELVSVSGQGRVRLPVITDIIEGASGQLMALHVDGPLAQPVVRARILAGLTDELRRLFRKKTKKPSTAG